MKQAVPWWFFFPDVTFHYLMWLFCIAAVTWGWCDFSRPAWCDEKSMVPPYWEKGCWGVRHPFGKSSPLSWCGSYINARAMKNMGLSKKLGTPLQKTCACSIPHCWYPPFLDPCVSGGLMRMGHDIRQKPKKTSRMIPPLSQHYPNDIPIVIIIFPWYFHFFPPCTHYYPHDIPMPHFFYALWVGPGPSLGPSFGGNPSSKRSRSCSGSFVSSPLDVDKRALHRAEFCGEYFMVHRC